MQKETFTIHRGLAELKLIDARIAKAINELSPIGIYQADKPIDRVITQEDFKKNAEAKYDSALALISRKEKIKSAIVKANSITIVKVGSLDMTIAQAINMRSTIQLKKGLIDQLKSRQRAALSSLNKNNDVVNQNCQEILNAAFGRDQSKIDAKDIENVSGPYLKANEFKLFDPLKVQEKIDKLEEEVFEFETQVDAALSEINAVTTIEI